MPAAVAVLLIAATALGVGGLRTATGSRGRDHIARTTRGGIHRLDLPDAVTAGHEESDPSAALAVGAPASPGAASRAEGSDESPALPATRFDLPQVDDTQAARATAAGPPPFDHASPARGRAPPTL